MTIQTVQINQTVNGFSATKVKFVPVDILQYCIILGRNIAKAMLCAVEFLVVIEFLVVKVKLKLVGQ